MSTTLAGPYLRTSNVAVASGIAAPFRAAYGALLFLDLAKGDPEHLEAMVQAAVIDYRDVLLWQSLDR